MSFTPDPTLQAIALKDYDMVVAVTQLAINETMGEYLASQPQSFTILGKTDENGSVIGLTDNPADSNCSLSGTLALEKDPNTHKYINLVDLTTEKGNQTVQYNITMQNGHFSYQANGMDMELKQNSAKPWVFQMFVNLSMEAVKKSDLPDDLKKRLVNVDEDMFSIQQLYMDLNTAALNTISGGLFPDLAQTPAMNLLKHYLAQQQATNKPLFGVTVSYKNKTVQPPTLTPTFVDFCVTPYTDQSGVKSNPNLDTLNYLVMVNNHIPPKTTPMAFKFNWVTDEQINGVMSIKEDLFTPFVISQLNPLLKSLCPVMHCKADGHQSPPNDFVIKLNPGIDHQFNSQINLSTGQIGNFGYNTSDRSEDHGSFGNYFTMEVSGKYSMSVNIFLTSNTIKLIGSIMAGGNTNKHFQSGSSNNVEMPDTTFNWSVELELYFDAQNNGQLNLNIINDNFNSNPVVASHDEAWWEKFLRSLGGYMLSYTNDLGDLRKSVATDIEGSILANLRSVLSSTNHFIFPGAKTFAFKDPQFSNCKDLVSHITYLNPNA